MSTVRKQRYSQDGLVNGLLINCKMKKNFYLINLLFPQKDDINFPLSVLK
jgi:hypothetical protein